MCNILFLSGSFNHEIVSFSVFLDGLRFKGDFVGCEHCYSRFPVLSIGMKYLFASPPFQSMCVLCPRMSFVRQQIEGFCFCAQSATLCLLMRSFGPLRFQVVIDRCLFLAILSRVFQMILCFSFLLFFSFGWMVSIYFML